MADAREEAVRRILHREEMKKWEEERQAGGGLRNMLSRVNDFLTVAASAPAPVCLEEVADTSEENTSKKPSGQRLADGAEGDATSILQLNVVAGVLEPRAPPPVTRSGGLLLPTRDNEAVLDAERMRESQALLHLFGCLYGNGDPNSGRKNRRRQTAEGEEEDAEEVASTSSSEVDIMDATSGSDDDDDEVGAPPKQKKWVTEL